jgi:hypothetical protein
MEHNTSPKAPKVIVVLFFILLFFGIIIALMPITDSKKAVMNQGVPKVVKIDKDSPDQLIVNRYDILHIQPFKVPLVFDYLESTLKIEVSNDHLEVLDTILCDQLVEGDFSQCVFLYVRSAGESQVTVKLIDKNGQPVEGYLKTYKVTIQENKNVRGYKI